jgi:hypothetical protein
VKNPALALADGPVNLALVPEVQIVKQTESVTAFRLGIWSRNANTTVLDLSLVGENTGSVEGLQWTGAGIVQGNFTGWQHGWIAGTTNGNMQGLQTALYTKSGMGSSGVQIGLVNVINNKEKLKIFPIVNWKF